MIAAGSELCPVLTNIATHSLKIYFIFSALEFESRFQKYSSVIEISVMNVTPSVINSDKGT
jgi:hypothetical protein